MKKWSQLSNIKNDTKLKKESNIKSILEKYLVIETKNKDYTDVDLDISGVDLVEKELQTHITKQIIFEKIKTLQQFENSFRTGNLQFIDEEITRLKDELIQIQ